MTDTRQAKLSENRRRPRYHFKMSDRTRRHIIVLLFLLFGIFVDFLFNGIIVGFIFKQTFKEAWFFIYVPLYFAIAMALGNYLPKSKHREHSHIAVIAFLAGCTIGHITLVNDRRIETYNMNLDMQYNATHNTILLRSKEWPQILIVTSEPARQQLGQKFGQDKEVPVDLEIITDYGCNRSNAIYKVGGVDVQHDNGATWAWQKDNDMIATQPHGPGTEDQNFFWCIRPPRPKWMDESPWRPWDHPPKPTPSNTIKPSA